MIYFRKFLDMFFLSMVPSIISFTCMWRLMGYGTWVTTCIISTIIFYFGTVLLLRRFVRDIKSRRKYYTVHLITFAVYAASGALLLIFDQMYPFTWIYFHTRIFSILTQALDNSIPVWISYTLTMLIYLMLIIVLYPIFKRNYDEEAKKLKADEKMEEHADEIARHEAVGTSHRHFHSDDDDMLYSRREYMRMHAESDLRVRRRFSANKKASIQITDSIKAFFEALGSYSFYQYLYDKQEAGIDTAPIIKNYLNRRLHLHFNTVKEKPIEK